MLSNDRAFLTTALLMSALFAVFFIPLSCSPSSGTPDSAAAQDSGKVPAVSVNIDCEIKVTRAEGSVSLDSKPAHAGDILQKQSIVETGPDSICEIVLGGANAVRLSPETRIAFMMTTEGGEIQIIRGSLAAVIVNTGVFSSDARGFKISMPEAFTVTKQGFLYLSAGFGYSSVCICSGSSDLFGLAGEYPITMKTVHHSGITFRRVGDSIEMNPKPTGEHDDEWIESLAATVGVTVSWE